MVSTKYNKYYRLDVQINSDGSKSDKWDYVGPYYEIEETREEHNKRLTVYIVFALILLAGIFTNLWIYSLFSKTIYVILPFFINVVPVYLFIEALYNYRKFGKRLKINEKEKCVDRFKQASLFGVLFSGGAVIGIIVGLLVGDKYLCTNDYIFILFAVIMLIIFIVNAVISRGLTTKEIENSVAKKYEKL